MPRLLRKDAPSPDVAELVSEAAFSNRYDPALGSISESSEYLGSKSFCSNGDNEATSSSNPASDNSVTVEKSMDDFYIYNLDQANNSSSTVVKKGDAENWLDFEVDLVCRNSISRFLARVNRRRKNYFSSVKRHKQLKNPQVCAPDDSFRPTTTPSNNITQNEDH